VTVLLLGVYAERVVGEVARRLRDELDPGAIAEDLRRAVVAALEPSAVRLVAFDRGVRPDHPGARSEHDRARLAGGRARDGHARAQAPGKPAGVASGGGRTP
jgi:hypothetical protein